MIEEMHRDVGEHYEAGPQPQTPDHRTKRNSRRMIVMLGYCPGLKPRAADHSLRGAACPQRRGSPLCDQTRSTGSLFGDFCSLKIQRITANIALTLKKRRSKRRGPAHPAGRISRFAHADLFLHFYQVEIRIADQVCTIGSRGIASILQCDYGKAVVVIALPLRTAGIRETLSKSRRFDHWRWDQRGPDDLGAGDGVAPVPDIPSFRLDHGCDQPVTPRPAASSSKGARAKELGLTFPLGIVEGVRGRLEMN